jgi:hypothetical protein
MNVRSWRVGRPWPKEAVAQLGKECGELESWSALVEREDVAARRRRPLCIKYKQEKKKKIKKNKAKKKITP